jgi:DNA-binding response OmpR family regulator
VNNILIVEDDTNKEAALREFLGKAFPEFSIESRHSYQGGLSRAMQARPDLIILDMTMPTFDVDLADAGGSSRQFAGSEIIRELARKGVVTKVIVVTQYDTFGDGTLTLESLNENLKDEFPDIYVDAVYYNPSRSDWKAHLSSLVEKWRAGNLGGESA